MYKSDRLETRLLLEFRHSCKLALYNSCNLNNKDDTSIRSDADLDYKKSIKKNKKLKKREEKIKNYKWTK